MIDRDAIRRFYPGAEDFVSLWTQEVVGDSSDAIDDLPYPRPMFYRRHANFGAMTVDTTGRVRSILHEDGFDMVAPWSCGPVYIVPGHIDLDDARVMAAEHRHATRDEAARCLAGRGGERIVLDALSDAG